MTPPTQEWDGKDRRSAPRQPVVPHQVTLEDIWVALQAHIVAEERHNEKLSRAFPKNKHGEPDFEGHGEYHEKLIERAVKATLRNERIAEKFLAGGAWATVVVLGTFLMNGALDWLKQHLK